MIRGRSALGAILAVLGAALLAATTARAQPCVEPSALDLRPASDPLRVAKGGAGLVLTWEDVGAPGYRVGRGHLAALWDEDRYDHLVVELPAAPRFEQAVPADDRYFLVSGDCDDESVGRDSEGGDRPRPGLVRVTIGVEGGASVFGVVASVAYPDAVVAIEPDMVAFVGPFTPGAPGSPLATLGDLVPGIMTPAATFTTFSPDPSFDPPAGGATDVFTLDFGFFGTPPAPGDFVLAACEIRDQFTELVDGATCAVTAVDVLF